MLSQGRNLPNFAYYLELFYRVWCSCFKSLFMRFLFLLLWLAFRIVPVVDIKITQG